VSNGIEDLSREDLLKVMARDRQVKGDLANRLAATLAENSELMAIVRELEGELNEARRPVEEPLVSG
jgi:hypothetical protein